MLFFSDMSVVPIIFRPVPFMCRSAVTKFVSGANIFRRMPHEFRSRRRQLQECATNRGQKRANFNRYLCAFALHVGALTSNLRRMEYTETSQT